MLIKLVIHTICLFWAGSIFWLASQDALGADPVKAVIHFYGIGALNLLIVTLLISPTAKTFKSAVIMRQRRLLGLYCFAYACMHVLCFWWFELNFSLATFISELIKRPYIWLGMFALLILLVLAITSPNIAKKWLKKKWQLIHNFIYLAIVLVCWHFFLSRKADIYEPGLYALVALQLLGLRYQKFISWFQKAFSRKTH
ncbi:protein-methionine-sulfoxide reductase heme-binding subunit MsrQ [Catenovulum sp. SX2]|uniref:protein-methionine-sulfoxide reductase heme-binding subunit MsrQ n=1 Tax=Catenovulum sp. SX2 TaxID=3398614 RepID=UPI003F82D687